LLLIIQKAKILGIAFADDTMKGEAGKCLEVIIRKLQTTLDQMTAALDETGMKFSPGKTAVIVFSKKQVNTNELPKLRMRKSNTKHRQNTWVLFLTAS
jgi:hypothetical protein